jgi:hypothetical protein
LLQAITLKTAMLTEREIFANSREIYGKVSPEVTVMYLRLAFWTGAMAYISFLFARFDIGTSRPSPGVLLTATFFGAITGLALAGMFANRVKRKAMLR